MLNSLVKRLAALEAQGGSIVTLTLMGGQCYQIPSKRLYGAARDALNGEETADTRAIVASVSSNELGKLIELAQALCLPLGDVDA